jgi:hypothetical protein
MCEDNRPQDQQDETISAEAEKIVAEGQHVGSRVRSLVLRAIKNKQLGLSELGEVAKQVLDGSLVALEAALAQKAKHTEQQSDENRENEKKAQQTLGEIFSGIDEAFADAAKATACALDEAKKRGERFAKEDLRKTVTDLKAMEEMLFSTIGETAGKSQQALGEQLSALESHAREVGTRLRPSVDAALEAAKDHPLEFSREAVGQVAYAMSGLLQAAGDIISGKKSKE